MAIVFRTAGAWGPGSVGDLTPEEVDNNFWELLQRIEALENTPPTPISIDHFLVEGTLLTIVLTDASEHGPFVLPIAQWRWTGEWLPTTQYFVGDIVEESGNTYFIRVQHISGVTFDPGLFTAEGQVYILLLARATIVNDVNLHFDGLLSAGDDVLATYVAVRSFAIPANFTDSQAWLRFATTTSAITFPIYKNETIIGAITFTPGELTEGAGQFGVFASVDAVNPVEMTETDRLSIGQSYELDDTASSLSITFAGEIEGT